jgi:hypothetical protein
MLELPRRAPPRQRPPRPRAAPCGASRATHPRRGPVAMVPRVGRAHLPTGRGRGGTEATRPVAARPISTGRGTRRVQSAREFGAAGRTGRGRVGGTVGGGGGAPVQAKQPDRVVPPLRRRARAAPCTRRARAASPCARLAVYSRRAAPTRTPCFQDAAKSAAAPRRAAERRRTGGDGGAGRGPAPARHSSNALRASSVSVGSSAKPRARAN